MSTPAKPLTTVTRAGDSLIMPAFASAHSHAFQRALRGRTQRRQSQPGSFWSWRGLMYELVGKLSPADVFNISRFAFIELLLSGVSAVGEFHYLHHDLNGSPYDDRTLLADAVIAAAQEAGIRITLIRTAYFRGGHRKELEQAQHRFCDESVDLVLADVEKLRQTYQQEPTVRVGVAAHSIRAVPVEKVKELADYASAHDLPFHMHVAEQRQELAECLAEYGKPPVALLADRGILQESFVGIHATHLDETEILEMGRAKATVCLCRTTERDLGDGLPPTSALRQAGAKLCVGVDSHASSDAFEELRAIELDERSRTEGRVLVDEAPDLLSVGGEHGLTAIGMAGSSGDSVYLDGSDPALLDATEDSAIDAVVFAASPRAVRKVLVAGKSVVEEGRHPLYEKAAADFIGTLKKLQLA